MSRDITASGVVATEAMMKQAHEVCAELQSAPDWKVAQQVGGTMVNQDFRYKRNFVALARNSYCPNS